MASLATLHGVSEETIEDWSSLRNVLDSFGWLARRVGDYSVSDTSLIFAIFKALPDDDEKNELGLVGRSGVVALRGTRFQEQWGKNWTNRFRVMKSANMAETREHYERQMKGLKDDSPADGEGEGGALEA